MKENKIGDSKLYTKSNNQVTINERTDTEIEKAKNRVRKIKSEDEFISEFVWSTVGKIASEKEF